MMISVALGEHYTSQWKGLVMIYASTAMESRYFTDDENRREERGGEGHGDGDRRELLADHHVLEALPPVHPRRHET